MDYIVFQVNVSTQLYSNNQNLIWLVHKKFHDCNKHVNMQYHFINEHQILNNINILYFSSFSSL
jgi:hypothetical protein